MTIQNLYEHKVGYIVIVGIYAVLHDAPVGTFDLDIVHSRTWKNMQRLIAAPQEMDADHRGWGEQQLVPESYYFISWDISSR